MESNHNKNLFWRFGVVANVCKSHTDGKGNVFHGTKAFPGGTKVYLSGKNWDDAKEHIEVIGQNRFGRYALETIPVTLLENVRPQRIFKLTVLSIIDSIENMDGELWWDRTAADRKDTLAFVEKWNHTHTKKA